MSTLCTSSIVTDPPQEKLFGALCIMGEECLYAARQELRVINSEGTHAETGISQKAFLFDWDLKRDFCNKCLINERLFSFHLLLPPSFKTCPDLKYLLPAHCIHTSLWWVSCLSLDRPVWKRRKIEARRLWGLNICYGFRGICSVALLLARLQANYSLISHHSTLAVAVLLKPWVMSVFNTIPVDLIPCSSWWDILACSPGISSEYSEVVHLSTSVARACAFTELPFSSEIASPKIHTNPWRLPCPCSEALVHVHAITHKVYMVLECWRWEKIYFGLCYNPPEGIVG